MCRASNIPGNTSSRTWVGCRSWSGGWSRAPARHGVRSRPLRAGFGSRRPGPPARPHPGSAHGAPPCPGAGPSALAVAASAAIGQCPESWRGQHLNDIRPPIRKMIRPRFQNSGTWCESVPRSQDSASSQQYTQRSRNPGFWSERTRGPWGSYQQCKQGPRNWIAAQGYNLGCSGPHDMGLWSSFHQGSQLAVS